MDTLAWVDQVKVLSVVDNFVDLLLKLDSQVFLG